MLFRSQKTIDKTKIKDIIKQTEVLQNKYLKEENKNGRKYRKKKGSRHGNEPNRKTIRKRFRYEITENIKQWKLNPFQQVH